MEIRKCELRDAKRVHELLCQLRNKNIDFNAFQGRFTKILARKDYYCICADVDGVMVGHLLLEVQDEQDQIYWGTCAWIKNFIVDEAQRGKGVGSALIDNAIAYAKSQRCEFIQLICNLERKESHKFYEKHGFEKTSYRFKMELH